jgi:hypothetical protein
MHLIIGIDPGTTTGLAAVTLEGKLRHTGSSRNTGIDDIIRQITTLGRPSLIASDVTPTPDSVMKIASSFGCAVFTLYEPLSVIEKNALTSGYETEDLHARDALAAALNAYNKYKNKLNKITALGYADEVKHRVLQGKSIEKALREIESEKRPHIKEVKLKTDAHPRHPRDTITSLLKQNNQLREEVKLKDFEISQLKKELTPLKTRPKSDYPKSAHARQQEQVIDSLQYKLTKTQARLKDIDRLTGLWRQLAAGKITPVGIYPETYAGITTVGYRITADDVEKLKNTRLVFTDDTKNREMLSKHGIHNVGANAVTMENGVAYLPTQDLQKLLHPPARSIEAIIDEYRKERK